jgi:hypothetical protein
MNLSVAVVPTCNATVQPKMRWILEFQLLFHLPKKILKEGFNALLLLLDPKFLPIILKHVSVCAKPRPTAMEKYLESKKAAKKNEDGDLDSALK